ncbi:hypothetical protein CCR97_27755 [Rhodoplanes elegans]|uniref:Uncharacterized protein n=1 Tax=Rhodoplanes elegans TaxID=29408 RepID=A0A327KDG4_9BRAD|nr:hypothetical protein [Rhodoplanes elegans]MBK5961966.1 hypothetical protein [Rhodoplanes elegans]RAI36161.1 hypothetical protein CH338_17965 [Rhodoplanes elegans]
MLEDTLKKVLAFLLRFIESPKWKGRIRSFGDRLLRIVGAMTVLSAIATLVATGSDFFTRTVPAIVSNVSRTVLTGSLFLPRLAEHVARESLGYTDICIGDTKVVDLDQDGRASDLIIPISSKEDLEGGRGCGRDDDDTKSVFVVLKETRWSGIWPDYALLHAFYGGGIPTYAETMGSYVLFITAARVNPGYHVFAYANGTLLAFGQYRSQNDAPPNMQVGNRLFLKTVEGFRSFEITALGEARTALMPVRDLVRRNNTVVLIEDEAVLWDHAKADIEKIRADGATFDDSIGDYRPASNSTAECRDLAVFRNGDAISLKGGNAICRGEMDVRPFSQIISSVECDFVGFRTSPQFPWGNVPDPSQAEHLIRCRPAGIDSDPSYEILVRVSAE